jgi:hypothetical protein
MCRRILRPAAVVIASPSSGTKSTSKERCHIVSYDNEGDNDALTSLPAFAAFQDGGAGRRIAPPDFADVTVVGNYRMLAE